MTRPNDNIKIPEASFDSGWRTIINRTTYKKYNRELKLDPGTNVERVIDFLESQGDNPGLTSIVVAPGLSKNGFTVLVTTYDTSG